MKEYKVNFKGEEIVLVNESEDNSIFKCTFGGINIFISKLKSIMYEAKIDLYESECETSNFDFYGNNSDSIIYYQDGFETIEKAIEESMKAIEEFYDRVQERNNIDKEFLNRF